MEKKLIIFDFDGVLLDSFEYAFSKNNIVYKDVSKAELRSWFEGNFYEDFIRRRSREEAEAIHPIYWKEFEKDMHQLRLFPGVKESLDKLSGNYTLIIISSCRDDLLKKLLEQSKIDQYFNKTYGSSYHESKIEKFKHALRDFGTKETDCLFITDTLGDLIEAEKAGIESIAVSWGYHDADTLKRGKSKIIIHRVDDLIPEIENYFSCNPGCPNIQKVDLSLLDR